MSPNKNAKASSTKVWLHVEILQNGVPLAATSQPLRRGAQLTLQTQGRGPLVLPHFPLPDGHYPFLRCLSRHVATLTVDQPWEGFCTSGGQTVTFRRAGNKERELELGKGDYASLENGSLRLLVRLDGHRPKAQAARPLSFVKGADRSSFLAHFLPARAERYGLAGAAVLAAMLVGGLTFGLCQRTYVEPQSLTDIKDEYMLPFVHPEHLRHAPEALQANLDRAKLARSTVLFYQSLTAMLMGWKPADARFLFPTSMLLYDRLFAAMKQSAREKLRRQKEQDGAVLEAEKSAVLAIPAAVGESLGGSMLRVVDKIAIMHDAFALNLAARRAIAENFADDPVYDFEEYRSINQTAKKAQGDLGKAVAKSFGSVDDEELMYAEAQALAHKAQSVQKRHAIDTHQGARLDPAHAAPLALPDGTRYATYVDDLDFLLADEKLYRLEASEFGVKEPVKPKVREPLVGQIEPNLIEKIIRQNRFQLQLCYELALRRNEGAAGTMEWQWRIDSRGTISDVALVASAIKDQKMISCIRDKISSWRFPRPRRGSVEVRYPFDFNPTKG